MSYSKEELVKIYKALVSDRILEERLVELYALGWVPGHIHSGVGEEASYEGVLATRKEGDYFKLTHRNVSAVNTLGLSFRHIFCEILGKMGGNSDGKGGINHLASKEKGIIGMTGALGCTLPIATGVSYSLKMRNVDNIVYCFLGDGTTSRGTFHEALNWASTWKLPILFIVNNNQWAISTHISEVCNVENPGADRAAGYNIPGKVVDGTNVLEVYDAAKELVASIRAGNGPAILESRCYRWRGHFEGDQCGYRDAEITSEWLKKDCVANLEKYMEEEKVLTKEEMNSIREEIAAAIEDGITFAENAPQPELSTIYDNLYA